MVIKCWKSRPLISRIEKVESIATTCWKNRVYSYHMLKSRVNWYQMLKIVKSEIIACWKSRVGLPCHYVLKKSYLQLSYVEKVKFTIIRFLKSRIHCYRVFKKSGLLLSNVEKSSIVIPCWNVESIVFTLKVESIVICWKKYSPLLSHWSKSVIAIT